MLIQASSVPVEVKHARQSHIASLNVLLMYFFGLFDQFALTTLGQAILLTTSEILNRGIKLVKVWEKETTSAATGSVVVIASAQLVFQDVNVTKVQIFMVNVRVVERTASVSSSHAEIITS